MVDDVEVLVVAYRAAELLDECLRRLEEELPVTVVDNSSDPEVRAVAIRHRATYVDPGRNLGFAGGVNVGLARRSKPAVDLLLLNPDASIDPSGVRDLHRCLHTRRELACVAPAQTSIYEALVVNTDIVWVCEGEGADLPVNKPTAPRYR